MDNIFNPKIEKMQKTKIKELQLKQLKKQFLWSMKKFLFIIKNLKS